MKRTWMAMAIGAATLAVAVSCGGKGAGDVGIDDLPIRMDVVGDAGRDGITADTPADLVATDPGADGGLDAPDVPALDPGVDPGVTPDDGTGVDEGFDPGIDPGIDPGPPPCDLGRDICFGTAGDGKTRSSPKIIGRIYGALGNPFQDNPDTSVTDDGDDLDDGCWDAGNDFYYKVYLRAGELLNVQMKQASEISMVLKAYRGTACASDPSTLVQCVDTTNTCGEYKCGNLQLTADVEGWYTIVLDGETYEDQGRHLLVFNLMNCSDATCCCPY